VFRSRKSAWSHFGEPGCTPTPPACIDPLRTDEKERLTKLREAQEYASKCEHDAIRADDRASETQRELDEFRAITGCRSVHGLRMWLDSQQARVVTANALIDAIRQKAPDIYAEVIR